MSTTDVLTRVREFVHDNFLYMRPDFQLGDDDRLLGNGVIDSMGVMELTEFLSDEFGIRIADVEITETNLGTLRSITRYVEAKLAHRGATNFLSVGVD
jgi:acyl carrier protein